MGSYLAVEHTSFLIDLLLVIVVDAEALEEDLVFVGGHGSLIKVNKLYKIFDRRISKKYDTFNSCSASVLLIPPCWTIVQNVVL